MLRFSFILVSVLITVLGSSGYAKGVSCLPDGYPHVKISPGWDCNKASTATEKAICENQGPPHYPAVKDFLVGQIYKQLKNSGKLTPVLMEQFRIHKDNRDYCGGNVSCISTARGTQLKSLLNLDQITEGEYEIWYCEFIETNNLMPSANEIAAFKAKKEADFAKKVAEEEARKAKEAKQYEERMAKLAEQKTKEEAEQKLSKQKWDTKREALLANSIGYRNVLLYMTKKEILEEAKCTLTRNSISECYGLDNIKFGGTFEKLSSEFLMEDWVLKNLQLDLGPLDTYSWISALSNWSEADPEDRNIYQNMRAILDKKYKLDFEFSERDITFFDDGERNTLRVSYNKGQVTLELRKKKVDYSTDIRLFLNYQTPELGANYLQQYEPKKAKASDF